MEKDNQNTYENNKLAIDSFKNEIMQKHQSGMLQLDDFDIFITTLPNAPDKITIKRLLIELPNRLLFLQNEVLNYKKQHGNSKLEINSKKRKLEIEKSEVRKKEMDAHNDLLKEFRIKSEEIMLNVMGSNEGASLKKTYLQEMLKIHAPSKPTRSDLDDIANVETAHLQKEIDELESTISDFSLELEILNTKKDFYENMWITIRAYKGILVEEMRMGEH